MTSIPEPLVDPLLLVVYVPRPAPLERRDVTRQHHDVRSPGVQSLNVAMQIGCRHYSHCQDPISLQPRQPHAPTAFVSTPGEVPMPAMRILRLADVMPTPPNDRNACRQLF